jgi:hypothetical protein
MTRPKIPKRILDKVLGEYDHKCAVCGHAKPHLHHIDGNSSNHAELNLIPLCPNHHLIDQHDPTRKADAKLLSFFRMYRDPHILSPKFKPLFDRLEFLFIDQETNDEVMRRKVDDLINFVQVLKMGRYFAQEISDRLRDMPITYNVDIAKAVSGESIMIERAMPSQFEAFRIKVIQFLVEALKYQDWSNANIR